MNLRHVRLHHLALTTGAPETLARFYERALGYRASGADGDCIDLVGPNRRLRLLCAPERGLSYAAYGFGEAREYDAWRAHVEELGLACAAVEAPGLCDAISIEAPGARRLVFGVREAEAPGAGLPGRLQHVVYAGPDIDRLTAFLVRVGFAVSDDVRRDDGALTAQFLRSDDEHHSIAVFLADTARLDHHCYEADGWDDIKHWADRLATMGVELEWGPGRHGPGNNLFAMFKDPDGNWIEISAELERVAETRAAGEWKHEPRTLNRWGRGLMRS